MENISDLFVEVPKQYKTLAKKLSCTTLAEVYAVANTVGTFYFEEKKVIYVGSVTHLAYSERKGTDSRQVRGILIEFLKKYRPWRKNHLIV